MLVLPLLVVIVVIATVALTRRAPRGDARSGPSALAEGFGYAGTALALSGLVLLIGQSWDTFDLWTRLGLLAATAGALLLVGLLLPEDASPVVWRLRGVTMLLSSGALAGFTGVFAAERLDWDGPDLVIAIGGVLAVYGAALWWMADRPLQHATTLVGLLLAVGGTMASMDGSAAVGGSMIVLGAGWSAAGAQGWLPPRYTAVPLGLVAALIGPLVMTPSLHRWAPLLGLGIAAAAVVAGVLAHERMVSGLGAVAAMGYLPATVARWFGHRLEASTIMLLSGLLLLAVMAVLLRHPHDGPAGRGRHGGFHLSHHART